MLDQLRKLNFQQLISVGVGNVSTYSFCDYKANNKMHSPITGYCTCCEENGCSHAENDNTYRLTNISHGAHSSDFLLALNGKLDVSSCK